jgi:general secretion pathway protein K
VRGRARLQTGIALLLVLWVIALLTIIAVGLTATQRTETSLAGNQVGTARFRALSDAAVNYALLNLMVQPMVASDAQGPVTDSEQQDDLWAPDGSAHVWSFAGQQMEIAIYNEASRIDLNQAPREQLVALFTAAGVPEEEVNAMADAIVDWRDPDDLRSADGAEDSDYKSSGLPYGAKDGPFDSVQELQQVMGVTPALYRVLEPALTVAAASPQVVPEFASPLVTAALQGITEEEAASRLQEQSTGDAVQGATVPRGASLNRGGPLYRIRVTLAQGQSASRSMEELVRIQGGGSTGAIPTGVATESAAPLPFSVLWRRYGLSPMGAATGPSAGS